MRATKRSGPLPRLTWRAAASPGGLIGLIVLLASLAMTLFLAVRVLPGQETSSMRAVVGVGVVVGGALVLTLGLLLFGYFTLSYTLDRQALTIRWGWSRQVIPLAAIEFVGPASHVLEGERTGASLPWPGYYLETYALTEGGSIRTFATQPLHRQVVVCTATGLYALSPERPVRFMEELVRLRERVTNPPPARAATARPTPAPADAQSPQPTEPLPVARRAKPSPGRPRPTAPGAPPAGDPPAPVTSAPAGPLDHRLSALPGLLRDRSAQSLVALALVLGVAMLVYIVLKIPTMPDRIPLHFNALSQVDRIGQPREILVLPGIVFAVILVNAILALSIQRYDQFSARLLLAGPVITGLVAWVAVMNLL